MKTAILKNDESPHAITTQYTKYLVHTVKCDEVSAPELTHDLLAQSA